jgi:hypothetical protein
MTERGSSARPAMVPHAARPWAGPGCAGLGRAAQGWAGLRRAGPGCAGLGRAGPGWAGPGCAGPGRAGPGWAGPGWTGLDRAGLDWARLGPAGSGCAGLRRAAPGCAGLRRAAPGWVGLRRAAPSCAGLRRAAGAITRRSALRRRAGTRVPQAGRGAGRGCGAVGVQRSTRGRGCRQYCACRAMRAAASGRTRAPGEHGEKGAGAHNRREVPNKRLQAGA